MVQRGAWVEQSVRHVRFNCGVGHTQQIAPGRGDRYNSIGGPAPHELHVKSTDEQKSAPAKWDRPTDRTGDCVSKRTNKWHNYFIYTSPNVFLVEPPTRIITSGVKGRMVRIYSSI